MSKETTKKITYKELNEVVRVANFIMQTAKDVAGTKFEYAFSKFTKTNYKELAEAYNDELADIRIDHALEDSETKAILKDESEKGRGFMYSKKGLKDVIKAERDLDKKYDKKEVEVEPYISSYVPKKMSQLQTEILTGFLIK